LTWFLREHRSPSLLHNQELIRKNSGRVWIISGGFSDYIASVAGELGIPPNHVIANTFLWDGEQAIGYNTNSPLAHDNGKVAAARNLAFPAGQHVIMVGDGMTDYAVRKAGVVDEFIAYTETVRREPVVAVADRVAKDFDTLFHHLKWR